MRDALVRQDPAAPQADGPAAAWPRLSIVTPSLNRAQFLDATIRSVVDQQYPNLDYAVVDGGSTDGSVDVIRRYADRLSYWVSEPDAGQADAINKGWRRASGEIIAYLNADDVYLPGAVRRAVAAFQRDPQLDMLYSDCQMIDAEGAPLHVAKAPDASWASLLRAPIPQPTVFMRRRVLERVGWFDPSLHYIMDWEFCLRAALAGAVIRRLPGAPLAAFRLWDGQKTASLFERQIAEQLRVRDRLLASPGLERGQVRAIEFSKAWAFLWPAYQAYVRGDMACARELLARAMRQNARIAWHPAFIGLYARTLLGARLSRLARDLNARWRGRTA